MSQKLPGTCEVALKEWSGICEALRDGRQILLLRKGGIAEEQGVFRPEHGLFWLYPTHVHQQTQGLKWPAGSEKGPHAEGVVVLDSLAVVTDTVFIDREEVLERLDGWHAWSGETVQSRFRYRRPGLWVLTVRVYLIGEPWRIATRAEYEGCKSWVHLEQPLAIGCAAPVLDDDSYQARVAELRQILNTPAPD